MTDDERRAIADEFDEVVSMTPSALENWLESDESRAAGERKSEGRESTGHASGRRIVSLLRKKSEDYEADDYDHMTKVVGYVRRHAAQRPSGDVRDTRWRHSLMNWGHDPLK